MAHDIAVDGIDEFLTGFLPRSRTPLRALKIEGDRSVIDQLRDTVHIRWG